MVLQLIFQDLSAILWEKIGIIRGIYDFCQNFTEIKSFYLHNVTINFLRVECYLLEKILRIATTRLLSQLVLTIQNIPLINKKKSNKFLFTTQNIDMTDNHLSYSQTKYIFRISQFYNSVLPILILLSQVFQVGSRFLQPCLQQKLSTLKKCLLQSKQFGLNSSLLSLVKILVLRMTLNYILVIMVHLLNLSNPDLSRSSRTYLGNVTLFEKSLRGNVKFCKAHTIVNMACLSTKPHP